MPLTITFQKNAGIPDENGWSQIYHNEEEKNPKRGRLFGLFSTSKNSKILESVSSSRLVFSNLQNVYYSFDSDSPLQALKKAHASANVQSKNLWGDVEIVCLSFVEDISYISVSGGAKVFLFRSRKLHLLADSDTSSFSLSGRLREGDVIIAGSKEFFKKLGVKLEERLGQFNSDIKSMVKSLEDEESLKRGDVASLFVKAKKQAEVDARTIGKIKTREENKEIPKKIANDSLEQEDKIYVKDKDYLTSKKNRKVTSTVGVIFLVLLFVSMFFGVSQKRKNDQKEYESQKIQEVREVMEESIKLFPINPKKAEELFDQAQNMAEELKNENITDGEIEKLAGLLEEKRREVLGEYNVKTELFVDMTLISESFSAQKTITDGETIYTLDTQGSRIISTNIKSKNSKVFAGPSTLDSVESLTAYAGRVFIIRDKDLLEVKDDDLDKIGTVDNPVLLEAYSGNLYILDKKESNIYKYQGSDGNFSEKTAWLSEGIEPDFSQIISWSFDGAIWLLAKSGKIYKYMSGYQQDFSLQNLSEGIESAREIYTDEDSKYLYVLDSLKQRVVVFDKNGEYKYQYVAKEIAEAVDIVVSEEERLIIFTTKEKLFSFDIVHK